MFNKVDLAAIKVLASKYGVPLSWALGLAEVESAGRAWWSVGGVSAPAINLEGHYFYRLLPEGKRAEAVKLGLAHPEAGKTVVPTTFQGRYDMLDKWISIDADAALQSISMGVGQVMGEHYKRLGFKSVSDMWALAKQSLSGQVELMLRYIITDKVLVKAIAENKYAVVARLYNGPAYKKNAYDTKIAAAVAKWAADGGGSIPPSIGTTRYNVDAELANIKKLGFPSVEAFQQARGLSADGIIGPITRDAIEAALTEQAKKPLDATKTVVITTVATGTLTAVINEVVKTFEQTKDVLAYIKTLGQFGPTVVLIGATSLVVGITVFSFYRASLSLKAKAV